LDLVGVGTAIIDLGTITIIGVHRTMADIILHTTLMDIIPTTIIQEVLDLRIRILDPIRMEIAEEIIAIIVDQTI